MVIKKNILVWLVLFCQFFLFSEILNRDMFVIDVAVLETDSGVIKLAFFEEKAPIHVANFKKLIENKIYQGVKFHRVIPEFMIQAGDQNTKDDAYDKASYGSQSYGETQVAEIGKIHFKGALAAARLADDVNPEMRSSGSQFYICVRSQPKLDGKYTVFGRVVEGLEVVDKISKMVRDENDVPNLPPVIRKTYLENYFDEEKYEWVKRNGSDSK